jgi:urease accessory protein
VQAERRRAMTLEATDEVFADNRSFGRIGVSLKLADGATRRGRVLEEGALRLRCPGPPAREIEAVVVNTAGGMAGGDRFELDIAFGPGARLLLTSAAAEKVYRTLGPDTTVTARLAVGLGGALFWLPQETILFDRARLKRSIEVDLAGDARLLLAEAVIFGRAGMGETMHEGLLLDRWRVRRDGRLIHAESLRLDGDVAGRLGRTAIAKGGIALATMLLVPGDDAIVAAIRARAEQCRGEIAASAWNGRAVVRLVAPEGAALRHDLVSVLSILRDGALPRLWLH